MINNLQYAAMEKDKENATRCVQYLPFITCAFIPESSDKYYLTKAGLLTYFTFCGLPVFDSGVEDAKGIYEDYSIG